MAKIVDKNGNLLSFTSIVEESKIPQDILDFLCNSVFRFYYDENANGCSIKTTTYVRGMNFIDDLRLILFPWYGILDNQRHLGWGVISEEQLVLNANYTIIDATYGGFVEESMISESGNTYWFYRMQYPLVAGTQVEYVKDGTTMVLGTSSENGYIFQSSLSDDEKSILSKLCDSIFNS